MTPSAPPPVRSSSAGCRRTSSGAPAFAPPFPPAWSAADRTGTGDGLCNDYAFARRPGAAPLVMAAYYDAPGMEMQAQEAVLRELGRTIVTWAD